MLRAPRSFLLSLPFAALAGTAVGGDVSVQLDSGTGFVVKDDTGFIELLRVDEATGNIAHNGALFIHTTGSSNTFVGVGAGNTSVTGTFNTALGANALLNDTTGGSNAAFGANALLSNTSGGANAAFGDNALRVNTSGGSNSAFGTASLAANTTGVLNSAFGAGALQFTGTGSGNSAFGPSALNDNTTGNNNSAFGLSALTSNTTGQMNVAVGFQAGIDQTTGSNNIYLANSGVAGESGQIKIGAVGTHTQATIAGISGNTSASGDAVFVNASGVLGTLTSSARFKDGVRDMGSASEVLQKLRPVVFHYKAEVVGAEDAKIPQYGLIAEEVAKVAPDLVSADARGHPYSVRYQELAPMLLNEQQRQQRTIEEQQQTIETQQRALEQQQRAIAALEAQVEALARRVPSVQASR